MLNKVLPTVVKPSTIVDFLQSYLPNMTIRNRECNNRRKVIPNFHDKLFWYPLHIPNQVRFCLLQWNAWFTIVDELRHDVGQVTRWHGHPHRTKLHNISMYPISWNLGLVVFSWIVYLCVCGTKKHDMNRTLMLILYPKKLNSISKIN